MTKLRRDQLHHYQERAVNFIKEKWTVNLWLGLSLGKTISTLTAIQELYDDLAIDKVVIFAPLRVAQTVWEQEGAKWEHTDHLTFRHFTGVKKKREANMEIDAAITLVNYENIPAFVKYHKDNKIDWNYDMLVFDESTKMKNSTSKRFRALKKLLPKSNYRVNLTGTPAANGLMDLYGQSYLLDGGARLGWTLTAFKNSYFDVDYFGYTYTPRNGALKRVQDKLDDITLSMSTEDYLDLPPIIYDTISSPLEGKLLEMYKKFEDEMMIAIEGEGLVDAVNAAVLTNKLRQFSSGVIYDSMIYDKDKEIEVHDLKLKMMDDIFEDNPDEDFIIVYEYRHELRRLKERYPDGVAFDGNTAIDAWNEGKVRKLFINAKSAGHGINLQYNPKGNSMMFFTLPWSLEEYKQVVGRIYRQNATEVTKIIHLAVGAVDNRVANVLAQKDITQNQLLEALK